MKFFTFNHLVRTIIIIPSTFNINITVLLPIHINITPRDH